MNSYVYKPDLTLEQVAKSLIAEAEEAAKHYLQQTLHESYERFSVTEAFVYAYILAGLRFNLDRFRFSADMDAFFEPKHVVAEAMKQRFDMSNEDFATDILGG